MPGRPRGRGRTGATATRRAAVTSQTTIRTRTSNSENNSEQQSLLSDQSFSRNQNNHYFTIHGDKGKITDKLFLIMTPRLLQIYGFLVFHMNRFYIFSSKLSVKNFR